LIPELIPNIEYGIAKTNNATPITSIAMPSFISLLLFLQNVITKMELSAGLNYIL